MYEHKRQPLASKQKYFRRLVNNIGITGLILGCSLLIGILGYRFLGQMKWIDSLHNASMILSGMGPVFPTNYEMPTSGIWFSSFYALFSGVVFITSISFVLAPVIHRFFHKLHVEEQ
jgi:hypothetical protein